MTKEEFIRQAKQRGMDREETRRKFEQLDAMGKFDDVATAGLPAETDQEKPRNLFSLPDAVEKAVFPSSGVQATGERQEGFLPALGQAGDALGLPVRAAGMLRGYKIDDPESNVFRPEIDKAKNMVSGGPDASPPENALQELSGNLKRGAVEIAGGIVGDPFSYTGVARLAGKPLKSLGTKIEQSVIGKGNKALAKKSGTTIQEASQNVLKHNVGGNLKQTSNKIQGVFDDLERQIDDVLADAARNNPSKINVDDALQRVGERVTSGKDPLFFGQTDQAERAWQFWVDELQKYGFTGEMDLKDVQIAKRLLGRKAFKKGAAPTPDINAKEDVADLIYLAFMDEVQQKAPAIKPLNKMYKELIPAKKMAEGRLLVQQGNDVAGLGSLVSGGAGLLGSVMQSGNVGLKDLGVGLGAAGLYNLSKSGKTAQALYNLGGAASKIPLSAGVGGAAYGATRVVNPEEEEENRKALDRMGKINWNNR